MWRGRLSVANRLSTPHRVETQTRCSRAVADKSRWLLGQLIEWPGRKTRRRYPARTPHPCSHERKSIFTQSSRPACCLRSPARCPWHTFCLADRVPARSTLCARSLELSVSALCWPFLTTQSWRSAQACVAGRCGGRCGRSQRRSRTLQSVSADRSSSRKRFGVATRWSSWLSDARRLGSTWSAIPTRHGSVCNGVIWRGHRRCRIMHEGWVRDSFWRVSSG